MTKTVLVTGGAGFIGSHYVRHLLQAYCDIRVVNADVLTYAGNLYHLQDVHRDPRYDFKQVDLAEKEQVEQLFQEHPIDQVVHFAAESHVDRSIAGSEPFMRSNIVGTYHLLEAAKKANVNKFVHISTDEVYGNFPAGKATEQTNLAPSNPYAASKASSDLLCLSFYHTYRFPVVITRCTNNYGPNQYPEKLIPCTIGRLLKNQSISIYGDGKQERDWIHVLDHCLAVDQVRRVGEAGEVYHIGAENVISNLEVVRLIICFMKKSFDLIQYVPDRPGHDTRYALDTRKIGTALGWKPTISFEQGLQATVKWYQENQAWWNSMEKRRAIK
jgi:dTDP-glucose 4,6-dehydratase